MEIQNNKEEIPFSHYADLFSKADPAEIAARLEGIECRGNTSCPDQLAKAIRAYKA